MNFFLKKSINKDLVTSVFGGSASLVKFLLVWASVCILTAAIGKHQIILQRCVRMQFLVVAFIPQSCKFFQWQLWKKWRLALKFPVWCVFLEGGMFSFRKTDSVHSGICIEFVLVTAYTNTSIVWFWRFFVEMIWELFFCWPLSDQHKGDPTEWHSVNADFVPWPLLLWRFFFWCKEDGNYFCGFSHFLDLMKPL